MTPNRTLTAEEVVSMHEKAKEPHPLRRGLVAWWFSPPNDGRLVDVCRTTTADTPTIVDGRA